jgi:hypothetical protein
MHAQPDRLPAISAALVLEVTRLEVFRDQFGMIQCRQRGIGPLRKKLGPALRDVGPEEMAPNEAALDQCRILLEGLCERCEHTTCPMKAWGLMGRSSA